MDGFHLVQHLEEPLLCRLSSAEHRESAHLSEVVGSFYFLRLLVNDGLAVRVLQNSAVTLVTSLLQSEPIYQI